MLNPLEGFTVPEKIEEETFVVRKMCASDIDIDFAAVKSSVEIIKKQMPGNWPDETLNYDDDLIDLCWHQREFEYQSSFAFIVTDLEGKESKGCLYIFPSKHLFNEDIEDLPSDCDVVIDFWVTQKAFDEGFYPTLGNFAKNFIKQWPYKRPYFSNILKS